MSFELTVLENTPLVSGDDIQDSVMAFLTQIGYLSANYQPRTANALSKSESVPYLLFSDCFLPNMNRGWKVEELTKKLKTTPPTVYRHINKLQMIGVLDHSLDESGGKGGGNVYRVKFGDLSLAWKIVETNVDAVKHTYRGSVDFIEEYVQKELNVRKTQDKPVSDASKKGRERESFRINLIDRPIKSSGGYDETLVGLLTNAGYLERSGHEFGKVKKSIPYRLFAECFMKRRDRLWDADSLVVTLRTSKPTIYRHLNKLLALGILEGIPIGNTHPFKVGYRLRYGNFSKAWYFVENRIDAAMRNYRKTVDYIQRQASQKR
jgi:predicted transcriptional regulator